MAILESPQIDLENATLDNTPDFVIQPGHYQCKVIDVYDGDTCTIALVPNGQSQVFKIKLRIKGIDTPEKRPKRSQANCELEKQCGLLVAEIARKKINGKMMQCEIMSDKMTYGRYIGDLTFPETNLAYSSWIIDAGLGKVYGEDQTHREPWDDDALNQIINRNS